jgi:TonB family protein
LKNTSPAKLVGARNPCEGGPAAIANAPQNPARAELRFASASVSIVAQCGDHEAKLQLSDRSGVDFDQLRMRTLGAARPFDRPSPEQNFSLQQAGAAIVPELLVGQFDAGFSDGTLGKVLADYRGPVKPGDFTAQLMNADTYQFANYVPPIYPAVAKLSQIHGRVMLEVGVDAASGEVRGVTAPNGDPLLTQAAIAAAQKWRFVPRTVSSQPIHAMLDFAWRCP